MDKTLKAGEICRIIEACLARGVKTLKYGDLQIEFSQGQVEMVPSQGQIIEQEPLPISLDENQDNTLRMDVAEEQLAEDALHAQLLIDDPLAFEKMQMYEGLEQSRVADETI